MNINRVVGAILLIAGSCMGAGMLGLPIVFAVAGFFPSLVILFGCWLLLVALGFLFIEVNLWFSEEVSIVTMAEKTLGKWGKRVGGSLFALHLYLLMVVYLIGSGQLVSEFFLKTASLSLSEGWSRLIVTLVFGAFLYLGMESVDYLNRFLIAGFCTTYGIMVAMGWKHVNSYHYSFRLDWMAVMYSIPTIAACFGCQNILPSLTAYLNRDALRLRFAVVVGTAIPLVVYLIWNAVILSLIPLSDMQTALKQGSLATSALSDAVGAQWIVVVADYFVFFAITTSFLGVGMSLIDFFADGISIKKDAKGKGILCVLTLIPPLFAECILEKSFLSSLSFAGAFGSAVLSGVFTVAMAWSGRYIHAFGNRPLLPGGKGMLIFLVLVSLFVVTLEFIQQS
ncbi:MAG: aromatic amino acid transport family protein [Waddliaceae bacterium]